MKPYLYSDLGPGHHTGSGLQPTRNCAKEGLPDGKGRDFNVGKVGSQLRSRNVGFCWTGQLCTRESDFVQLGFADRENLGGTGKAGCQARKLQGVHSAAWRCREDTPNWLGSFNTKKTKAVRTHFTELRIGCWRNQLLFTFLQYE